MKRVNLVLSLLVVAALAGSVALYRAESGRIDRFESGRSLIPGLNPDGVATIVVAGGGSTVHLERSGDRFVVVEAEGYPARNQAVNRLLRELSEITLAREVGSGEELAAELAIEPPGDDTVTVRLEDGEGSAMVELVVGATADDGSGSFVQRRGGEPSPIYLSEERVRLATGVDTYLEREIVDVDTASVARLEGPDYVLVREEDGLALQDVPAGREVSISALNRVRAVFSRLELAAVHLADDPAVADLGLVDTHRVVLDDDSGYVLATARRDGTTYARIRAFHAVERLEIRRDSPDEELEEKAEVLERADEVQRFNQEHGSWVYELAATSAGKVELEKEGLLEGG